MPAADDDDRVPSFTDTVRQFWEDEVAGAQFITPRKVGSK